MPEVELYREMDREKLKIHNNETLTFPEAQIKWRNFAGEGREFNAEGDRNFHLILDRETAEALSAQGFNIKVREPANAEYEPEFSLRIAIGFKTRTPPKVVLIGSKNKTSLTEDLLIMADWAEIDHVNLICNVRYWEGSTGNYGLKVWLKAIYIEIRENEFELQYAELPETTAYDALEALVPDLGELDPFEQSAIEQSAIEQ